MYSKYTVCRSSKAASIKARIEHLLLKDYKLYSIILEHNPFTFQSPVRTTQTYTYYNSKVGGTHRILSTCRYVVSKPQCIPSRYLPTYLPTYLSEDS